MMSYPLTLTALGHIKEIYQNAANRMISLMRHSSLR